MYDFLGASGAEITLFHLQTPFRLEDLYKPLNLHASIVRELALICFSAAYCIINTYRLLQALRIFQTQDRPGNC